ncbi:MAG: SulP family inorganic anion transporter [Actinobacteria bacterium]|nr:SulP family inorganic anion transporter [Actinomycetota bacterium]
MRDGSLSRLLPRRGDYAALRSSWRVDLLAGVTVAVVALPLALAFGVASGLGARAGLVTAIVAGIAAGVFGGSNVQVSGPTGAMTVVLAPVVAKVGFDGVIIVALAAGAVLMLAGAARLGRYVSFLPWPVIEGFTVGIGIIIFLQQVPAALGLSAPVAENTAVSAASALSNAAGAHWQAVAVVAIVSLLMVVLPRMHRSLPASLVAVVVATALAELAGWEIPRIGAIPSSLPLPGLPGFDFQQAPELVSAVFAVAALAAIESLLSARVADGMADGEEHDPDRELFGQGVANAASALFGGMPATGAIARTAVNVRAGARTRLAATTHGVVLVAVVLLLAPAIGLVPLAALAGVLMVTAVHMVEFGSVGRILRSTRADAAVLLATATATVAFDLVVAVEVGIVLASVLALRELARSASFERDPLDSVDIDPTLEHELIGEHVVAYRLDGALFFGAAQRFLLELTDVTDVEVVILRLGRLRMLDATGAQALGELVTRLQNRGIKVMLVCVRPQHRRLIEEVGVLDALAHENRVLPTIDDALVRASDYLSGRRPPAARQPGTSPQELVMQ